METLLLLLLWLLILLLKRSTLSMYKWRGDLIHRRLLKVVLDRWANLMCRMRMHRARGMLYSRRRSLIHGRAGS